MLMKFIRLGNLVFNVNEIRYINRGLRSCRVFLKDGGYEDIRPGSEKDTQILEDIDSALSVLCNLPDNQEG